MIIFERFDLSAGGGTGSATINRIGPAGRSSGADGQSMAVGSTGPAVRQATLARQHRPALCLERTFDGGTAAKSGRLGIRQPP